MKSVEILADSRGNPFAINYHPTPSAEFMTERIVLVVGGGGREHALTIGLIDSPSVVEVHVAPGNAGTEAIATNHNVRAGNVDGVIRLAESLGVNLVVVGPEGPLCDGLADRLRAVGIDCFGPHAAGAMLEGSKEYAKDVMNQLSIPTAALLRVDAAEDVEAALDEMGPYWVIKRDVLAGGKGVTVTGDRVAAEAAAIEGIEMDGFVLLEEFMEGEEASMLVIMDESAVVCLPASQDHKRVFDGDAGPNTGGMGAYAPAPIITESVRIRVMEEIIQPMHHHLRNQAVPYRGCLYVGLMIDPEGAPRVVEFNVRFGDPETQVTIPLIESDLAELLHASACGELATIEPRFSNKNAITIVLASEGYPARPIIDLPIGGGDIRLEEGESCAFVHHAGTRLSADGTLLSTGGRVLSVTGLAPSLRESAELAYQLIDVIDLEGSHFRRDIGHRGL